MKISSFSQGNISSRNITPIDAFDIWIPENSNQRMLWPSTVTFSDTMYKSLKRHALPVNSRVVKALAGSARKMDMYYWFSYRLTRLEETLNLSWEALYQQFGQGYALERQFRPAFRQDLKAITEILPDLPVALNEFGAELKPAELTQLALPPKETKSS